MDRPTGSSEKRQWTSAHSQLWTAFKTSQTGRREAADAPDDEGQQQHGKFEKHVGLIDRRDEGGAHFTRSPSQTSIRSLSAATSPFGSGGNDTSRYQPIEESARENRLLTSSAYWSFEKLTKAIRLETEELVRDSQHVGDDDRTVVFGFSEEVSRQIALHLGSTTVAPEVKDLLHAVLNSLNCKLRPSRAHAPDVIPGSGSKERESILSLHSAAIGLEAVLHGGGSSRSRSGTRDPSSQEQQQLHHHGSVPTVANVTERLRAMHDDANRAFEDLYAIYADIEAAVGNPVSENENEPIANFSGASRSASGGVSTRYAHPDNILRLSSQVRHGVSSVLAQWEKATEAAPVGRSSASNDDSTAALWSALKELSEILESGAEPCLSTLASAGAAPCSTVSGGKRDESAGRSGENASEEYQRRLLLASLPSLALRVVRELEGERRRVHRLNIVSSLYERNVSRRLAELGVPPAHIPTLAAENVHLSTVEEEEGTHHRVGASHSAAGRKGEDSTVTSSSSAEDNWIIDSIRELEAVITGRDQEALRHMEKAYHSSSFNEEHESDGSKSRSALQGSTNASVARDVRHYVRTILYCAGKELLQREASSKTGEAPEPSVSKSPSSTATSPPMTAAQPLESEARVEVSSVAPADAQQSRVVEIGDKASDNAQVIERAIFRLAQLLPTGIQPRTYPGSGEAAAVEPPVSNLDAMIDLLESRLEVWRQQVHKQATHSASRRLDQARFEEGVKTRSLGILSVLQSISTMTYVADCGEHAPGDEEADDEDGIHYDRRRDETGRQHGQSADIRATGESDTWSNLNSEKKPEVSADVLDLIRSAQSKERGAAGAGSGQTQANTESEQRRFGASGSVRSPAQTSVTDTLEDIEERVRLLATQYSKVNKLNTSNKTRLRNLQSSLDAYQRRWGRIIAVVVPICEALNIDGSALKVKSSHFSSASAIRATVANSDTLPLGKRESTNTDGQRDGSTGVAAPSISDVAIVEALEDCLDRVIKLNGHKSPSKATKAPAQEGEVLTTPAPSTVAAVEGDALAKPESTAATAAAADANANANAIALQAAEAELQRVRETSKLDREMFQAALEVILERLGEGGKLVKKVLYVMGTDESAEDDLVERVVKRKPLDSSAASALSREERDKRHAETEDFLAVLLQKFGRWSTRLHETMDDHLFTQKRLLQYYAAVYHYVGTASSNDAALPPAAATLLSRVKTVDNLIDIDGVMSKFADGILPALDRAVAEQSATQEGPTAGRMAALLNARGLRAEPFSVFDHRLVRVCEAVGKLRKVIQTLMRVHYLTVPSKGPARSNAKGSSSSSRKRKDDLVFLSDTEHDDGFVEIDLGKIQEEVLAALDSERDTSDKVASISSASSTQKVAAIPPAIPIPKPPKTEVRSEDVEDEWEDVAEITERDGTAITAVTSESGTTANTKRGEVDTESLFRIVEKNIASVTTTTSRFSSNYKLATILVQKDMESIQQNLERMLAKYSELDVEKAFAQDREELHELYQVIHDRRTRQRGCYFFNRPDGAGSCIWSVAIERLTVGFDAIVDKLVQRTQMAKRYRDILSEAMDISVAHVNWAIKEADGVAESADIPPALLEKCIRGEAAAGTEGDGKWGDGGGSDARSPSSPHHAESNQLSHSVQSVTQLPDERTFLELFTFLVSRAEQPPKPQQLPSPTPAVEVLDEADDRLQVLREQLAVAVEKLRNGTEDLSKVEAQRDLALSDAAIARAELRRFKRTIEAASENRTSHTSAASSTVPNKTSVVSQRDGASSPSSAAKSPRATTPPHAVRAQSPPKSDDYNRPLTVGELRSMFDHLFSNSGTLTTDACVATAAGDDDDGKAEVEAGEAPATTRTPVSAQKTRRVSAKPRQGSSPKQRSPQRNAASGKAVVPPGGNELRKTVPHRVESDDPLVFVSSRHSYASSTRARSPQQQQHERESSPNTPPHGQRDTGHYSPKQFNSARFNKCDTCTRRHSTPAGERRHVTSASSMRYHMRGGTTSPSGSAPKRSPSRGESVTRSPSRQSSNGSQVGEFRIQSTSVASSDHTHHPSSSLAGYYGRDHVSPSTPPLQRTPSASPGQREDAHSRVRGGGGAVSPPPTKSPRQYTRRSAGAHRPTSPEVLPDLSDLLSSLTPLRRNERNETPRDPMTFGSGEAREARQRSYAKIHRHMSPPITKRMTQRKGGRGSGAASAEGYRTPPARNPYRSNPNLMSEGLQSLANAVTRTRVSGLAYDDQF